MFTMAKIRNGSTYLESHLGANDYYSKGERVAGLWIGLGAKQLGLRGEVLPNQFEALRVNENPLSGLRLTPRTKQDRVAFFDFQCSAQKSVSIMAVLAGDERLRAAHARCSLMALGELEKFACRQRNNAIERKNEITGNICAAAFTHDASRALDPQLHTHFVVANATRAGDQWFALNEHLMLEAIRYAGKVYQNEMAREVRALGYGIRQVREDGQVTGFEIEGVSQELCDRFSKRRKEIEEGIEAFKETYHREPTRKEIAAITRESRPAELREITTTNVRQLQFGQLEAEEWAHLQSVQRQAREQTALPLTFSDAERTALKAGVEHLFERKSVLREHEILAEALNQNLGSLDLAKLTSLAKAEKAGLVRLVEDAAEPLRSDYATRHGLASELWSVEFVKRTNGTCQPLNPEFEPSETLYPQQKEAVKSILENENRVQCFRGVAGSGKTTTLSEVRRGLEAAGHKLFTVAPTASASKTLRESGFKEATTLADFLQNGSKTLDLTNGILVCDEAGLQSNRDGEAVLRLAGRNNMRVIFVGDVLQHVSVEAGDFLRVLEDHSPLSKCELTEILRQQHDGYLEAVSRMAEGDPRAGLGKLDDLGWIKEGQSHYIKNAAEDYLTLSKGGQQMEKCMVVAPTWEENRLVTNDIRTGLKERDILGEVRGLLPIQPSLNWTKAQKADSRSYEVGQIVTFTKTNTKWKAGESAIVQRVSSDGVRVASASKESYLPLSRPDSFDVGFGADVEICRGGQNSHPCQSKKTRPRQRPGSHRRERPKRRRCKRKRE